MLIVAMTLLWPLARAGYPSFTADSAAYYTGGREALSFLKTILPAPQVTPPMARVEADHVAGPAAGGDGVRGVRSISYSVFSYVLAYPGTSMIALAIVQALMVSAMFLLFCRVAGLADRPSLVLALAALLATTSALPLFVTLATPDVFAGLTILGVVLLAIYSSNLSLAERLFVIATTAFSIAAHASHILLAVGLGGLIALGAGVRGWRSGWAKIGPAPLWVGVAILGGLAIAMASAIVGFGDVSVAPKRYPFALARSIEDGPARWYLNKHCATERYAVCELFPNGFPSRAGNFLWGAHGLSHNATPGQMDRIRAEELIILQRTLEEYPSVQARASLNNLWSQILEVGMDPSTFQNKYLSASGALLSRESPPEMTRHAKVQQALTILSLVTIALLAWRADRATRLAILLTILAIAGNDVICAIIAAPDIRYQNRVLWLLTLFAFLLIMQQGRPKTSRKSARADQRQRRFLRNG